MLARALNTAGNAHRSPSGNQRQVGCHALRDLVAAVGPLGRGKGSARATRSSRPATCYAGDGDHEAWDFRLTC